MGTMRQTRLAKRQEQKQNNFINTVIQDQRLLPTINSSKIGPNGRLLSPNHAKTNRSLRVDEQIAQHPLVEPSLRLSNRKIQWIPKQLFQLSYIENLYLDNNKLDLLPDRFFEKLPQLKYFDLRNNQLTEIPTIGLATHKNLQVLLLSRNQITHLPLEIGFIRSLNALHWIGNPIEYPHISVLEQPHDDMKKTLRKIAREKAKQLTHSK